jgi:uncharacterized protein YjbJ (UPF0337 family)
MAHDDHDQPEKPATWENIIVGKTKETIGRAIGDEELATEGEDQEKVAHEVRSEFESEHEA